GRPAARQALDAADGRRGDAARQRRDRQVGERRGGVILPVRPRESGDPELNLKPEFVAPGFPLTRERTEFGLTSSRSPPSPPLPPPHPCESMPRRSDRAAAGRRDRHIARGADRSPLTAA